MSKSTYERRKAAGLCTQCGKVHVEYRTVCPKCAAKSYEKKKQRMQKRSEEGICPECGKKPVEDGKSLCRNCLDKKSAERKHLREWRKQRGYCVECGDKAVAGETLCSRCKMNKRDSVKPRTYTPEQVEARRKKDKQRYSNRKINGMCTACGKRVRTHGTLCGRCYSKVKIRVEANKNDLSRGEMPEYGICYCCCKKPVMPGKRVCEDCYETRMESISKIMYMTKEEKNVRECGFKLIGM